MKINWIMLSTWKALTVWHLLWCKLTYFVHTSITYFSILWEKVSRRILMWETNGALCKFSRGGCLSPKNAKILIGSFWGTLHVILDNFSNSKDQTTLIHYQFSYKTTNFQRKALKTFDSPKIFKKFQSISVPTISPHVWQIIHYQLFNYVMHI